MVAERNDAEVRGDLCNVVVLCLDFVPDPRMGFVRMLLNEMKHIDFVFTNVIPFFFMKKTWARI